MEKHNKVKTSNKASTCNNVKRNICEVQEMLATWEKQSRHFQACLTVELLTLMSCGLLWLYERKEKMHDSQGFLFEPKIQLQM